MTRNNNQSEDTPFNFAMLYYIGLNELLGLKEKAAVEGDLRAEYIALKQIRYRISFKLSKSEKKELDVLLTKANELLKTPCPRNQSVAMQLSEIVNSDLNEILEKIDAMLWSIMNKYKMIFPNMKIESGGLEGVRKRLNLEQKK